MNPRVLTVLRGSSAAWKGALGRSTTLTVRPFHVGSVSNAARWYPDLDYLRRSNLHDPILYYDQAVKDHPELKEVMDQFKAKPFMLEKPVEKSIKNMQINFGPQHPAAHGVLRLVLQLDGEVK